MSKHAESFVVRAGALKADLVEQGRRVQSCIELSFEALFSRNESMARDVLAADDAIDIADVDIEKTSVSLLTDATRQGAELDPPHLRAVLTIVKVNNEMERIADVGVDIAELVISKSMPEGNFPDTFRVMANSVIGIVRDVDAAFARSDPQLANIVLQSQHAVTAFKAAVLRDAEAKLAQGKMSADFAFLLHEVASQCELIADHCTNIAEQVIYSTTGAIVRHMESAWVEVNRPTGQG